MKSIDDKCLAFVVAHYKPNRLNTQKAYHSFLLKHNLNPSKPAFRLQYLAKIAAVLMAIILPLGFYLHFQSMNSWVEVVAHHQTLDYMLPDSSRVTLAPNSTIRYNKKSFMKESRCVEISGRAFFNVKKHANTSFIVEDKMAQIIVLGTQFQVTATAHQTDLFVESGSVMFAARGEREGVVLTKGMFAMLTKEDKLPQLVVEEKPNPTSWMSGQFIYKDTPLAIVLQELSSFYNVTLTTNAVDKRLSGSFSTQELDELIAILERALNVKIEKQK